MDRNIDLNEMTDGKRYGLNDLVKVGCNDCEGCSACCRGMGNSIILDPLDVNRIINGTNVTFAQLLEQSIELNVVDGLILPNLKMSDQTGACTFLNEAGRCSVHTLRPGICRIFPLGRIYENDDFSYILQIHECKKANKSKVKVQKWIDTPDLKQNVEFINHWHSFIKEQQTKLKLLNDVERSRKINLYILNEFFVSPYHNTTSFYVQFEARLANAKEILASL